MPCRGLPSCLAGHHPYFMGVLNRQNRILSGFDRNFGTNSVFSVISENKALFDYTVQPSMCDCWQAFLH